MDEAGPYMEVGQQMIARHAALGTDHSWLILESRHRGRYAFGMAPPMVTPAGWIESGYLIRAGSVGELAERTGMAPGRLRTTLDRFNAGARAGRRSEEHTSELQSLMRISYAVFCLKKKKVQESIYNPTI